MCIYRYIIIYLNAILFPPLGFCTKVCMFTGILTGSVYDDVDLKRNGFPGEALSDNSVLVIKTHDVTPQLYEQAVLLVRHPAGTLLAEYNRRHHGHVGMDPAITFDTNPGTLWGSYKVVSLPGLGFRLIGCTIARIMV